jgi:ABC-type antimicrobial peptide transport system permease subunit
VLANLGALAAGPPVLATLLANILLLCLRAWSGSTDLIQSRRLFYLLDGMIAVAFVLFLVLVVIRFETLG